MRYRGIVYRAHSPQWAFAPTSGEGALKKGGRFNPKGIATLYTSLSVQTCALEMGHGFKKLFSALTICSYKVDVEDVVDLTTTAGRRKANATLRDLKCAWLADAAAGIDPPSWIVAERLRTSGASGILVPSFARSAGTNDINLVLWRWGDNPPHQVVVHDPDGVLPRDDASWAKSP